MPQDTCRLQLSSKGFSVFPSDQIQSKCGIGIVALGKGLFGFQLSRIHSSKDIGLQTRNLQFLRYGMIKYF